MNKTRFILTIAFAGLSLLTFGQKIKYIGVEAGINYLDANFKNSENIRSDMSYLGYPYATPQLNSSYVISYAGLRLESMKFHHLSLSTGISYSSMTGISSANSNYYVFYRYYQDETTAEYARINKFSQIANYISVPLELRYFPFLDRTINIYFMCGFRFNSKINSKMKIQFVDPSMSAHEQEIVNQFDQPQNFNAWGYIGVGMRVGKQKSKSVFGIEALVPSFNLTDNTSGMIQPSAGGGLKIYFMIPLTKQK